MRTLPSLAVVATVAFALVAAGPVLATNGCSAFEPEVGARQQSSATTAPGATDVGGYGPTPDGGDGGDPRCLADGGSQAGACDVCENANCCTTRFGCYDDKSCYAAKTAFDPCIAAAVDVYGQPDPVAVKKCWDTFAASGAPAAARVECQRAKCKTICSVP
jgi:hypothetical protein